MTAGSLSHAVSAEPDISEQAGHVMTLILVVILFDEERHGPEGLPLV
jgi:hypothetical protein